MSTGSVSPKPFKLYKLFPPPPQTLVIQGSILTFVYFPKPDRLRPILQHLPFHHNLISTHSRQNFRPSSPISHAQQKHTDADDGENVIRVSIWVGGARGRDKGDEGEEDVRQEENDDDG